MHYDLDAYDDSSHADVMASGVFEVARGSSSSAAASTPPRDLSDVSRICALELEVGNARRAILGVAGRIT